MYSFLISYFWCLSLLSLVSHVPTGHPHPSPPHSSLPNIPEPISDVIPYVVPSNIPDDIAVISADITNVDAFNVIINALRSSYELENVYNPSQENAINYALDIIQDLEHYFHVQQNE